VVQHLLQQEPVVFAESAAQGLAQIRGLGAHASLGQTSRRGVRSSGQCHALGSRLATCRSRTRGRRGALSASGVRLPDFVGAVESGASDDAS
jgi:hypothetical protein